MYSSNTIICGDCLSEMKKIPSQFIQTIISSPPYNIGKNYESKTSIGAYTESMIDIIEEFARILKPNGTLFWQVGNYVHEGEIIPLDVVFWNLFKPFGFKLRNRIVWHFRHGLHCKKRFSGRYETVLFFTLSDDYVFNLDAVRVPSRYPGKKYFKGPRKGQLSGNPLGKNPSDFMALEWEDGIWDIPNVKHNHPEKTKHPCSFPVELAERCVLVGSNEGDIVLDPYAGAGSTVIAAAKNKRIGVGIEIVEEYCCLAKDRLDNIANLKLRPIGQKIYEP